MVLRLGDPHEQHQRFCAAVFDSVGDSCGHEDDVPGAPFDDAIADCEVPMPAADHEELVLVGVAVRGLPLPRSQCIDAEEQVSALEECGLPRLVCA